MPKSVAYAFLSRSRDWEFWITDNLADFNGCDDWYLAGEVSSLKELFQLMEDNDFDAEYFYEYVDHCMPHRIYNLLNKDGAY